MPPSPSPGRPTSRARSVDAARSPEALRRRRLQTGTEAHYRDALYYDHAYRRRRHDVEFYVEQARQLGGPVLELGVGTGRVAVGIGSAGVSIVGIDRMPNMLAGARAHVASLPAATRSCIELRRGDMLRVRLERSFPLVIAPFNVFMHLYERSDFDRAMDTVRAHITPRGRLIFDVLMPDLRSLARHPGKLYRSRAFKHPRDGKRYGYAEAFRYDAVSQVQFVSMCFEPEDAPDSPLITPLAHRQFFPAELEALLHYNGFEVEARYGDFDRSPLQEESESQIIVAKLRSTFASKPKPRSSKARPPQRTR